MSSHTKNLIVISDSWFCNLFIFNLKGKTTSLTYPYVIRGGYSIFSGPGHLFSSISQPSDFVELNVGGPPESPGLIQYVCHPGVNSNL